MREQCTSANSCGGLGMHAKKQNRVETVFVAYDHDTQAMANYDGIDIVSTLRSGTHKEQRKQRHPEQQSKKYTHTNTKRRKLRALTKIIFRKRYSLQIEGRE